MNISPIQVRHLAFRRVHIEVDVEKLSAVSGAERPYGVWDFDGVSIHTALGLAPAETSSPKSFYLTLRVKVGDAGVESEKPDALLPYVIDVEVGGIVQVNGPLAGKPDQELQELAAVNGAAVLWSSIREQIANVTGRMPPGQAVLPAANFQDIRGTPPRTIREE